MTPLTRTNYNPLASMMINRRALLEQPDDFFTNFFDGRIPTMRERLHFIEKAVQRTKSSQMWDNDIYIVEVFLSPPFVHLDIRRKDGQPCKNWHDFQQIKNELVGPEHEAVELFPAESRLVDTANQYHLWVHMDASYRFSLGFVERCVLEAPIQIKLGGPGEVTVTKPKSVPALDNAAGCSKP